MENLSKVILQISFSFKENIIFAANLIDLVAQVVEHLPFKERVLGSSPSQVTKKKNIPQ